jgi:DNA-binding transcriptional LysR family regulator
MAMDRLRAFEVFAAVVARGGFARAADALDTSPANVSRYVADLEAHLGSRLLNRTSRTLSLTEAGEAFYERVRQLLEDVGEAVALASAKAVTASGRLRINAPQSFGVLYLAPLWPQFLKRHPGIELDVTLTDRVVDLVDEGFDLGIRISRGGSQAHVARRLATSRNVLCASPDYVARHGLPQSPEDLEHHACVAYSHAPVPGEWTFTHPSGEVRQVKLRPRFRTNSGDTARAMALAGEAMTWQPTFLIGPDLRAGTLVQAMPDWAVADIDILAIYPSRRQLSAKVRLMVDFLADSFRGTPVWDAS